MHKRALSVILSLALLLFSLNFGVRLTAAQDTPAESTAEPQVPTEALTEVPTEMPTQAPTEVPTEMPTQAPTEVPTEPPTEVPTETPTEVPTETPSEVPPEATQEPLPEATLEPTEPVLLLTPPVFTLPEDALLAVVAGETLAFQVVAADDEGAVRVTVVTDTTAGIVNFQANPPLEVEPPYNTVVFITYTAPAEFSGMDNFTLVAIDPSGGQAELALTITVTLPVPLEESVVPTPNLMGEPVERIIRYNPAASEESITAMLRSLGAVELDRLPSIGASRVMIPETLGTMQSAVAAVSSDFRAQSAGIQAIEENVEYHITGYTPNDPYLSNQWGLDDSFVHSAAGTGAWDMNSRRGSGITVAVIDTGVDLQHPEFAGKIVAGWDFVNDDNSPDDDNNHGTHVAGVIAARTNNNMGIAGIAFNARIMPIKVCDYLGNCGAWEIAAGIVYAVDNRANVINMSLGGPNNLQTIEAAVQFAIANNVVVVASAGNSTLTPGYFYPASNDGVISVAAHNSSGIGAGTGIIYPGQSAPFNHNDKITVSAPGIDIFSTVPLESNSYQGGWNGTSMAAPHVSGIVALIMSANIARTPQQVKEALICSAWDMGTAGYDEYYGWGIVQADWAMNWSNNSARCKISQPNDNFEDATVLRVPTNPVIIQPIHTRSVSAYTSDPTICGQPPQQTLWYRLVAPRSAVYQFSTYGSSYDTVLGVYQGLPGELAEVGCNNDLGPALQSVASIGLTARQTYYIAVGSLSGTINDELLNFDVRYALPVPTRSSRAQQENNASISYRGSWNAMTYRGASGNRVMETYDNNATATFTFQGNTLQLSRTMGPTQGSLEVWVDGTLLATISNRAALNAYNQLITLGMGGFSNAWHTAVLRRASGGPSGPVDIDTINPQDGWAQNLIPIRSVADSLDTRGTYISYINLWDNVINAAAYRGTLTTTTDDTAFLLARALGDTISIYRSTGVGYGSMDVYLDDVFYATVDNTTSTGVSVPYTITGLSPTDHTIRLENNAASTLTIDKITVSTMRVMAYNRNTDDRAAASYGFTGLWTQVSNTSAYARTISSTSDPAARAAFRLNGNWVCIGYTARSDGGSMDVYVDNVLQGTINSSSVGTYYQSSWCSTLFADQTHFVELVYAGGGVFDLDFVNPRQYRTITFDRKVVQESDASITRNNPSNWFTYTGASAGGFRPNGGRQIWSNTVGSSLDFWINGTGFILYTSVGPEMGDWEVYVDGVLFTTIDLYSWRWRPMAYGITNLGPGFHNIDLVAINTSPGYNVYFDGVRAFP